MKYDHLNIRRLFEQAQGVAFANESFLVCSDQFERISFQEFSEKWFKKEHKKMQSFIGFMPYQNPEEAFIYRLESPTRIDISKLHTKLAEMVVDLKSPVDLAPLGSDEQYCSTVSMILEEILSGKYYQLNFLRFFEGSRALTSEDKYILYAKHLPRMFSYLNTRDLEIFSLSPERFVRFDQDEIDAFPIKGTRKRGSSLEEESSIQEELLRSPKDLAELAIIVDLMRHDLNAVCKPQSVEVVHYPYLRTAHNVHHLEAYVKGVLREGISFQEFCKGLLPSASITGAPKKKVVECIAKHESPHQRHFFMGNAFYYDTNQVFDSSVLIRTFVRSEEKNLYAAGSGITAKSNVNEELLEVFSKANLYPGLN